MQAAMETQATMDTQGAIHIEGKDVGLASQDEIVAGINAANEVFARHRVDPVDCAAADEKRYRGDVLLTPQEANWCLIWDEANYAAFHAVTLGWLSRDIDIQIAVR
jgi:hypothetical protein